MPIQRPVIVIPGITGTGLRDAYPVSPETVWGLLRKDELRAALHPDDLRYELVEPARVEADSAFRIAYGDLIEELRAELSTVQARTPVYPFPYDWRMPLRLTVDRFGKFVDEVIDRTGLLRHYHRAGYNDDPRVDLVAHSMGGLIIAGYLASRGRDARVGKVVTIATPFRGSLEAPIKAVTGTADLGEVDPNPRDRFGARLTPALYHLLPSFEGAVVTEDDLPSDLFRTEPWQPSVQASIAAAIDQYGREPGSTIAARNDEANELLKAMLSEARRFLDATADLDLEGAGLDLDDWLCLVGVDSTTRVRLPIRRERGVPVFDLRSDDRENRWGDPDDEVRVLTGDGTVPFRGALPNFLPIEKLVCLRPGNFGYWELRDRGMSRVAGFHAALPNMNLVHRLTAAFLLGDHQRKGLGGSRPPGVSLAEWAPPIRTLIDRTARRSGG